MDTRSIFRDRLHGRWRDGLLYTPPVIGFRSVLRGCLVGKSARHIPEQRRNFLLRRERGRKARFQENLLSVNHAGDRTANRHRWSGRVAQDERVRCPQGTRQKSGRNFGIRPAPSAQAGGAAVKVFLATVYQKHSSLRTRKRMYRG